MSMLGPPAGARYPSRDSVLCHLAATQARHQPAERGERRIRAGWHEALAEVGAEVATANRQDQTKTSMHRSMTFTRRCGDAAGA